MSDDFNTEAAAEAVAGDDGGGETEPPADDTSDEPVADDESERDVYDVGQYRPNDVVSRTVPLRGQVSKRSERAIRDERLVFVCQRCGTNTPVPQDGDTVTQPYECDGCERQGPFNINEKLSDTIDFQNIRLQELPEKADTGTGSDIDIELTEDLVGRVAPGDRIIVDAEVELRRKGDTRVRNLYGTGETIEPLEADYDDIDIEPHRERIEEIAADNPVEHLVSSIAPSHNGDSHIKKALAFQLFGGVEGDLPDGTQKRGNIHLCLIGDPGAGKSSLMRFVANLMPRAVSTTGQGTSSAGLTAAAVNSDFSDGWSLEAGALVEANGGIATVDELDKMEPADRNGLLQAMSEGEISISKAGINTTLPASATVLAAANPVNGVFDRYKNIADQIGLSPVLLSRFDLAFPMSDEPDKAVDREIAGHMNDTARVAESRAAGEEPDSEYAETVAPDIEPDVLRAYVALGREYNPTLTDAAADELSEDYVNFRQVNDEDGPRPITARSLEALHRLSEASARIHLRDEVTVEDVGRATEIHRKYITTLGMTEEGEFSARKATGADGDSGDTYNADLEKSSRAQPDKMMRRDRLQYICQTIDNLQLPDEEQENPLDGVPEQDILDHMTERNVSENQVVNDLGKLREQSRVIRSPDDQYRTT